MYITTNIYMHTYTYTSIISLACNLPQTFVTRPHPHTNICAQACTHTLTHTHTTHTHHTNHPHTHPTHPHTTHTPHPHTPHTHTPHTHTPHTHTHPTHTHPT